MSTSFRWSPTSVKISRISSRSRVSRICLLQRSAQRGEIDSRTSRSYARLTALSAVGQMASLRGPVSGLIYDASSRSIRPVVGFPGSSYLGRPILRDLGKSFVAPDGESIVYVVSELDRATDKNNSSLWMVPASGGDPRRLTTAPGTNNHPRFSPDGKTLASGSSDGSIILWDVATRQSLGKPLIGHKSYVTSVAFSPDGKILASGSDDNTIRMWRVSDGTLLSTLEGHTGPVLSVAFDPSEEVSAGRSLPDGVTAGANRRSNPMRMGGDFS